ncbi:pVIII [Odocoileus adenovirus 1]|uniref:Pre-hexon-linking protein VIII n=3 Tax=Deer atadenovirus A TaxID=2169706 RepID=A0A515MFS3_9ADEN|nr:pVIII [Odocoileus adenovirus 1]QDM55329.1 pVIII [Deer atadenovirus A]ASU50483.1 pIII [Odocoileus adenovirus 1]ASU50510.1 pIII [Odocoileus adenovirus 1]ASU50537.1 pIII [Odocoileus adenovirus 1]ASU50564.1 pIII [Odocoileus adenovirus 1]
MQQPVTPYIWKYQPETGFTAGAHQDYGAVINWFQANPQMFARIQEVNANRNDIDQTRAFLTRTDIAANINNWPSTQLKQRKSSLYIPAKLKEEITNLDFLSTANGIQLSGPYPTFKQEILVGTGSNDLTSYPMISASTPNILKYQRPGQQLQGTGVFPSNKSLITETSRLPRSGGLSPEQFISEFPPIVYNQPFSESLLFFPKEFNPLFDPFEDPRPTSGKSLQYY